MQKSFHFETHGSMYESGGVVVRCFDTRFRLVSDKYLKRRGIENPDIVSVAGGPKQLASPSAESAREFVLEQIRASIRLHRTPRALLMSHSDCGAYGGFEAFGSDRAAEARTQEQELRRAATCLHQAIPDIAVEAYFLDFEGVWEVEQCFAAR